MVIPVAAMPLFGVSGFALSAMAKAVAALYGVAGEINDFLDRHIQEMQTSANPTVATTGRVLEGAKFGFGLGYITSVTVIAAGQYLLGNTLAAVSTVITAAVLSNPIAMTCAALGALLYGWHALNNEERNGILDQLAAGLQIGVELIKSILGYVIQSTKDILGSKALKEFKAYIEDKAALFGRTLSDVTHLAVDAIGDAAAAVKRGAEVAIAGAVEVAGGATDKVGETLSDLGRAAGEAIDGTGVAARQVLDGSKAVIRRARRGKDPK